MRLLLLTLLGSTLLTLASAHHNNEEDHLLETLLESQIKNNAATRAKTSGVFGGFVDNYIRKMSDKVKRILATSEPYPVPEFPEKEIKDQNVDITIKLSNVKENKVSEFRVNKLSNSFFAMTEQFDLSFPEFELDGNYNVKGKILGKQVNGNGDFKIWVKNLHTWGKSFVHLVGGSPQLYKLNIDYTVEDVKAKATGLKVQGLSDDEVKKILDTALFKYYTDNEQIVSEQVSALAIERTNQFLSGKSIPELYRWMQHFIND